jgi:O-antigen ligase
MQLAAGPDSALRFSEHSNRSEAVGFFANRNHHAAFLLMALPLSTLAIAEGLARRATGRAHGSAVLVAAIAMTVLLMVGLALTRSRAGVLLGGLGFVLALAIAAASQARPGLKRAAGLVLVVGLLLSVQFGLSGLAVRFKADPLVDERWQFAKVTLAAAREHAPLGAGIGGFAQAYQAQDVANPGMAMVNHAHDDYLELWLEGGWPFAALALAFAALLAWAVARTWRRSADDGEMLPARAASVSLLLVCVHSAADYPLRTSANEAVFAVLLAVLFSAAWPGRGGGQLRAATVSPGPLHAKEML